MEQKRYDTWQPQSCYLSVFSASPRYYTATNSLSYGLNLWHQTLKLIDGQGLGTVLQRFIGVRVYFYQKPIGTCSQGSQRHRCNEIASSCTLAGIGDDRQM